MTLNPLLSPAWASAARHGLEALLNPFFVGFIVLMVILVRVLCREKSRLLRGIVVCLIIGTFGLSTAWLPCGAIHFLENKYTPVTRVDQNVHWVVVFGGGVYEASAPPVSEVLSGTSIKRLLEGVRLYRQLPDAKLILSGGGSRVINESVGTRMGELAAWFDIPAADRVLETDSVNTADEAVAIKQWVHDAPFYLVTSAIHMPRAMALCRRQGLNPIAAPCEYTHFWKNGRDDRAYIPNI